jgi:hypothetical protein
MEDLKIAAAPIARKVMKNISISRLRLSKTPERKD